MWSFEYVAENQMRNICKRRPYKNSAIREIQVINLNVSKGRRYIKGMPLSQLK